MSPRPTWANRAARASQPAAWWGPACRKTAAEAGGPEEPQGQGPAAWWEPGCRKTAAEAGGPEEPQGAGPAAWWGPGCVVGARLRGGGPAAWWGPGCRKTAAEAGGHTSWAFELLLCDSRPSRGSLRAVSSFEKLRYLTKRHVLLLFGN